MSIADMPVCDLGVIFTSGRRRKVDDEKTARRGPSLLINTNGRQYDQSHKGKSPFLPLGITMATFWTLPTASKSKRQNCRCAAVLRRAIAVAAVKDSNGAGAWLSKMTKMTDIYEHRGCCAPSKWSLTGLASANDVFCCSLSGLYSDRSVGSPPPQNLLPGVNHSQLGEYTNALPTNLTICYQSSRRPFYTYAAINLGHFSNLHAFFYDQSQTQHLKLLFETLQYTLEAP